LRRGQRRLGLANISGQATPISNRDPLSVIPISEPEINSTLCMAQPSQKRHTVLLTSTAAMLRRLAVSL